MADPRTRPKPPGRPRPPRPGAAPPPRLSPSTVAFGAVALVVVVVVALVIVKVTGSPATMSTGGPGAPRDRPASAVVLRQLTSVPTSVAGAVGLPASVTAPTTRSGQPPLTIDGRPGAVFIGGEFCPFCAAERWSIIMAFSKFGSFSHLQETTSSPWDSYPSTATFSFHGASYSSPYIALATSEHDGNDSDGVDTHGELEPLTTQEARVWQTYDDSAGFPFLDVGNQVFVLSPSYLPSVLGGLDQAEIAAKLHNPTDPVTEAIVGTANYLTAAICAITDQTPASVCSAPVVKTAAKALGLS